MKRIISILYILTSIMPLMATGNADAAMTRMADKIKSMKSMTITYNLLADGQNSAGTLVMSGDKFHISSDDVMVWYDGKTQWSYSAATNEVNIVEPSPEELVTVNPFVIINSFRKAYSASPVKSAGGIQKIRLRPHTKDGNEISEVTLSINEKTSLPTDITVVTSGGNKLDIQIKSIKSGSNYPHSTFVFTRKLLPKAEIIDLR